MKQILTFTLIIAAVGSLALAGCQHHDRHTSNEPKPLKEVKYSHTTLPESKG